MPTPLKYYPQRQRCHRCRIYFGPLVVLGLYCSYECAGKPDPRGVPAEQWPREHYIPTPRGRLPKRAYLNRTMARDAAVASGKAWYTCTFCWTWHIGGSL
jgi:hypothetical protein